MPRETVYGNDGFDVTVSWGRADNLVQVASTVNDSPARTVRMVREWLLQVPRDSDTEKKVRDAAALLDELGQRIAEIGGFFDGWHTTLVDRRGVNDVIRLLRKARDAAFGRDE